MNSRELLLLARLLKSKRKDAITMYSKMARLDSFTAEVEVDNLIVWLKTEALDTSERETPKQPTAQIIPFPYPN